MQPQPILAHAAGDEGLISWNPECGEVRSTIPPACAAETTPSRQARCLWAAGFIANRRELAERTASSPAVTDARLVETLYRRYGGETPRQIAGQFAYVLWDAQRRLLIAVRDRFGIHEIYFSRRGDEVLLSARIEPMLRALGAPAAVDPRAVLAHIHGQAPEPPATFYSGIGAVEPGGMLTVGRGGLDRRLYWRVEPQPPLELPHDLAYARVFRDVLLCTVTEYSSPGAVGVTLSGGLDSTTVAAAVRQASPDAALTAFSWSAPELPEADEYQAAQSVARRLGCPVVEIAADRHWPLRSEREPRTEPAGPLANVYAEVWEATFRAAAQRGVRVLLSGFSGDHLFGGNVFSYPDLLLTGRWRKLAAEMRDHRRHSEMSLVQMVRRMVLSPIAASFPARHRDRPEPVGWLGERLRGRLPAATPRLPWRLLPGRRLRLRDLRDPMLSPIASLMTAAAARHGLDFRHPLLDHRLVELAAALPTAQTFAAGRRKVVVRNAMRGQLPDEVLDRPDKTYPTAIAMRGLRERERAKVWRLMTGMRAAAMGFVDEPRLRQAYADFLAGRSQSTRFWNTLTLEAWLRRCVP